MQVLAKSHTVVGAILRQVGRHMLKHILVTCICLQGLSIEGIPCWVSKQDSQHPAVPAQARFIRTGHFKCKWVESKTVCVCAKSRIVFFHTGTCKTQRPLRGKRSSLVSQRPACKGCSKASTCCLPRRASGAKKEPLGEGPPLQLQ